MIVYERLKENLIARLPDELESSSWSHIKGLLVQFLSNEAQLLTPPQFARENYKHTKSIFKKKEKNFDQYKQQVISKFRIILILSQSVFGKLAEAGVSVEMSVH